MPSSGRKHIETKITTSSQHDNQLGSNLQKTANFCPPIKDDCFKAQLKTRRTRPKSTKFGSDFFQACPEFNDSKQSNIVQNTFDGDNYLNRNIASRTPTAKMVSLTKPVTKTHCSDDYKSKKEMEKKLFQESEETVLSPIPNKRVVASKALKDGMTTDQNAQQLPLGFQSFGTKDLADRLAAESTKDQNQIQVAKFNKIKALSPVNFFKDSNSKPESLAKDNPDSARAKTAIQIPAVTKTQSIYSPRMVLVHPNSSTFDKNPIKMIDQRENTNIALSNNPVKIERTVVKVKSANFLLRKQKSSVQLLSTPIDHKQEESEHYLEAQQIIQRNFNFFRKEVDTQELFNNYRDDLCTKAKESEHNGEFDVFLDRPENENCVNKPIKSDKENDIGHHAFELNRLTKHFSSPPCYQSSIHYPALSKLTCNQSSEQPDSSAIIENLAILSCRENNTRGGSKRKPNQKFKNQEAVLKRIFNFNVTTLQEGAV